MDEYPKWVGGVVVKNAEEEEAVMEGRAILEEVKRAEGSEFRIVGYSEKPKPKAKSKER